MQKKNDSHSWKENNIIFIFKFHKKGNIYFLQGCLRIWTHAKILGSL